jgi:hypothetical protein
MKVQEVIGPIANDIRLVEIYAEHSDHYFGEYFFYADENCYSFSFGDDNPIILDKEQECSVDDGYLIADWGKKHLRFLFFKTVLIEV